MNGHWSEKAYNDAKMYGKINQYCVDPKGL